MPIRYLHVDKEQHGYVRWHILSVYKVGTSKAATKMKHNRFRQPPPQS